MPYLSQGGRGQRIVTQEVKPEPEVPRDEVSYSWRIAGRRARHIRRTSTLFNTLVDKVKLELSNKLGEDVGFGAGLDVASRSVLRVEQARRLFSVFQLLWSPQLTGLGAIPANPQGRRGP
eukprot:112872-Pyramimonas_sp.AAC.1